MSVVLESGALVIVDWRDALRGEANKLRPAVVMAGAEMSGLPTVLLVPLAGETAPRIPGAFVALEPSAENGCTKRSYVLAHLVTATSKARIVQIPGTRITGAQLDALFAALRGLFTD